MLICVLASSQNSLRYSLFFTFLTSIFSQTFYFYLYQHSLISLPSPRLQTSLSVKSSWTLTYANLCIIHANLCIVYSNLRKLWVFSYDDSRQTYQISRPNNRISSHEYEYGNFETVPENETTPMLRNQSLDSEQHSLRRGQTLPRNGRLTDQHVEDAAETHHNSLPRQVNSPNQGQSTNYDSPNSSMHYYLLPISGKPNCTNYDTENIPLSPVHESEFPPPPHDLLDSPDHIYAETKDFQTPPDQLSLETSPRLQPKPTKDQNPSWIYHMPKIGSAKIGSR